MPSVAASARFPGVRAHDLVEVSDDLSRLEQGGRWAVALGFEGAVVLARFREWGPDSGSASRAWPGISGSWRTSLSRADYEQRVEGGAGTHRAGLGLPGQRVQSAQRRMRGERPRGTLWATAGHGWGVQWSAATTRPRCAYRFGLTGAVPDPGRRHGLVEPDQGHCRSPGPVPDQGPLGEHHDRRSGPQRPRAESRGPAPSAYRNYSQSSRTRACTTWSARSTATCPTIHGRTSSARRSHPAACPGPRNRPPSR